MQKAEPLTEQTKEVRFDYSAPAEIFGRMGVGRGSRGVTYRRFSSGAEALRFLVEEMPAARLIGMILQADDDTRFDHLAIRSLYESRDYPLPRREPASTETPPQGVLP